MQRIGGPSDAARRGAEEGEALQSPRIGDGEFLGHHPAEAHPHHATGAPADTLKQTHGVGGEISHPVGPRHRTAPTQTAIVEGQQVESASQRIN